MCSYILYIPAEYRKGEAGVAGAVSIGRDYATSFSVLQLYPSVEVFSVRWPLVQQMLSSSHAPPWLCVGCCLLALIETHCVPHDAREGLRECH